MRFVARSVALAAMCGSVSLMVAVSPALATFPGGNGKIAFSSDRDGNSEIYAVNQDYTGFVQLTALGAEDITPSWSASGSLIAFASDRAFGDFDIYRMDASGGSLLTLNDDSAPDASPSWSPSGTELAITAPAGTALDLFRLAADGTGAAVNVTTTAGLDEANPNWSPDGNRIAFDRLPNPGDTRRDIFTINPDGTGLQNVTNSPNIDDREPNWSPDGSRIAYASFQNGNYDIYTIGAGGGGVQNVTSHPPVNQRDPVWSPDGKTIAFVSRDDQNTDNIRLLPSTGSSGPGGILTFSNPGEHNLSPDWQTSSPAGYPRPRGATPFKVPYVVAYSQCNASNETHGPPLAFPSCNPPAEASTAVTVGTPDANGAAAESEGRLRVDVQPGVPGAPDDSDATITASISDVRCKASTTSCGSANALDGPDYTGALRSTLTSRITDHFNAVPAGTPSATVADFAFLTDFSCASTASTAIGGLCTVNTSINSLIPGAIKDGQRQIWEFQQATVTDGGSDGVMGTTPNTLFAVQGVFIP